MLWCWGQWWWHCDAAATGGLTTVMQCWCRSGRVSTDARRLSTWSLYQHSGVIPVSVWRWLPGGRRSEREPVYRRRRVSDGVSTAVWVQLSQHTRHVCLYLSYWLLAVHWRSHLCRRRRVWRRIDRSSRMRTEMSQYTRQLRVSVSWWISETRWTVCRYVYSIALMFLSFSLCLFVSVSLSLCLSVCLSVGIIASQFSKNWIFGTVRFITGNRDDNWNNW